MAHQDPWSCIGSQVKEWQSKTMTLSSGHWPVRHSKWPTTISSLLPHISDCSCFKTAFSKNSLSPTWTYHDTTDYLREYLWFFEWEMSPIVPGIWTVPNWWHLLGWFRRCGLLGRSISLEVGFVSLRHTTFTSCPLLYASDSRWEVPVCWSSWHACCLLPIPATVDIHPLGP